MINAPIVSFRSLETNGHPAQGGVPMTLLRAVSWDLSFGRPGAILMGICGARLLDNYRDPARLRA
jgi:hypothetical protein